MAERENKAVTPPRRERDRSDFSKGLQLNPNVTILRATEPEAPAPEVAPGSTGASDDE